jgi:hypothetical protein
MPVDAQMGSIFNFTTDFNRVMKQDVSEVDLPPLRESAEKACFIYIFFHGVPRRDETFRDLAGSSSFAPIKGRPAVSISLRPKP